MGVLARFKYPHLLMKKYGFGQIAGGLGSLPGIVWLTQTYAKKITWAKLRKSIHFILLLLLLLLLLLVISSPVKMMILEQGGLLRGLVGIASK